MCAPGAGSPRASFSPYPTPSGAVSSYNSLLVESVSLLQQALLSSAASPWLGYIRRESSGVFSPHLRKEMLLFFKTLVAFDEAQERLK